MKKKMVEHLFFPKHSLIIRLNMKRKIARDLSNDCHSHYKCGLRILSPNISNSVKLLTSY